MTFHHVFCTKILIITFLVSENYEIKVYEKYNFSLLDESFFPFATNNVIRNGVKSNIYYIDLSVYTVKSKNLDRKELNKKE